MTPRDGINLALKVIGLAGLVGVTVVAPNAIAGLDRLISKKTKRISNYSRLLTDLKRRGLIYVANDDDSYHYSLTPAGVHRLQQIVIDELEIPKQNKWDKKWRLVTFDVPVRHSKQRAHFTQKIDELGLVMLQRSIWVHPFPCFKQVEQIAGHYNVLRYCSFLEVTKLDELSTKKLLRHFSNILT